MHRLPELLRRYRAQLVEFFAASNLAFLAFDIWLAHLPVSPPDWRTWIPIWFSVGSAALLVLAFLLGRGRVDRGVLYWTGLVLGAGSVLVGFLGLVFHLDSRFLTEMTLVSLVYTSPFVAPLAYCGLGFVLLLNRLEAPDDLEWSRWLLFLAMGGFFGNFTLALCDHAINGFFRFSEWVAVGSAAFATAFLLVGLRAAPGRPLLRAAMGVMLVQMAVGTLGFGLHVAADLAHGGGWVAMFVHGAPVFAPLLFCDLAAIGLLALWDLDDKLHGAEALALPARTPTPASA